MESRETDGEGYTRGGRGYQELPARCWLSDPVRALSYWCRFPVSQYEGGLVSNLLSFGVPVPGHPAACTVPGCWHAQVWHAHKTRDHACRVAGCQCTRLALADLSGVPWAVPARVPC